MIEPLLHNIVEKVDPDELVEVLGLTIQDLVDILSSEILENKERFDYLDE
jgi:hypothetical protein